MAPPATRLTPFRCRTIIGTSPLIHPYGRAACVLLDSTARLGIACPCPGVLSREEARRRRGRFGQRLTV